MKKIVFFASGSGSNVENIMTKLKNEHISFKVVYVNNPEAYIIERAKNLNLKSRVFNKQEFISDVVLEELKEIKPDLIVLAGFLWLIPESFVKAFPDKIINIHPALLPKYGGKGMYGMNVHEAVKNNKEKDTGITIHYVNEKYDDGEYIMQEKCVVEPTDSAEDIVQKIHKLEYEFFPKAILNILR